jgi:hypothetical protein
VRPVVAAAEDEKAAEPALRAALARHGVESDDSLLLGGRV